MNFHVYQTLDTYQNKDGLYHIKIAVNHERRTDYISTYLYSSIEEWDMINNLKTPIHLQQRKKELSELSNRISLIVNSMVTYDIIHLRKILKNKPKPLPVISKPDVFSVFDLKIQEKDKEECFGTADNYRDSKSFFIKYTGLTYCEFDYFNSSVLKSIFNRAIKVMSQSNINRHMRHLRAVYNIAITEEMIDRRLYPFGKRKYIITQPRKTRKSTTKNVLKQLKSYIPVNQEEQEALDYFFFSYYCNGMNMKDLAFLKWSKIQNNKFIFYREKIKNTVSELEPVVVFLSKESSDILHRLSNKEGEYIFPILTTDNSKQHYLDYRNKNRVVNHQLKTICEKLSIPKITHGQARHTFASVLKTSGVDIYQIKEALGHKNISTTEHYLNSFDENKKFTDRLDDFINL